MLIIFDLDDTLIDTSGSITPHAVKWALNQAGVNVTYEQFEEANKTAYTSSEALSQFLAADDVEKVIELIHQFPLDTIDVKTTPGALELVDELKKEHSLVIVTVGDKKQQMKKILCAGFNPDDFAAIHITPIRDKKKIYQSIQEGTEENILVVGDRIKTDLAPAKALGMRTLHMRFGRGRNNTGLKNDADGIIDTISEVKQVIYEYEN